MFFEIDLNKLVEKIERCENVDDFKTEVIPLIKEEKEVWSEKIQEIIFDKGFTKVEFADKCNVSRVTVNKWCKGSMPKKRETFIKIGTVAGYSFDEMHYFLKEYGKCSGLYGRGKCNC